MIWFCEFALNTFKKGKLKGRIKQNSKMLIIIKTGWWIPSEFIMLFFPHISLKMPIIKFLKTKSIICIPTFITALCARAEMWKQTMHPSTDEWINKIWDIHKMKYYSALNRKENWTHETTWIKPWGHYAKCNKPVTKGQIPFHLNEAPRVVKFRETKHRMVVAQV